MFRFNCSRCGKRLKAEESWAGKRGSCKCGQKFIVPQPPRPTVNTGRTKHKNVGGQSDPIIQEAQPEMPQARRSRKVTHLTYSHTVAASQQDGVSASDAKHFRSVLESYAEAIPHHDIDDFGAAMTVKSATKIVVYRSVLQTLYEKREVQKKHKPFPGGHVPPRTVTESNIDVWSYSYRPLVITFDKAAAEHLVENSQEVRDCSQCNCAGIVTCPSCRGKGEVTCSVCGGRTFVTCSSCSGSGQQEASRNVQKQKHCGFGCSGGRNSLTGGVCSSCNGTGIVFYTDYEYYPVPCSGCAGRGEVRCYCSSGIVTCSTCSGNRQVTCPDCEGHGKLVSYLAIQQSYLPITDRIVTPDPDCPKGATNLFKSADYELYLDESAKAFSPQFAQQVDSKPLQEALGKLIQTSNGRTGARKRVDRQQLTMGQGKITHFHYKYGNKPYECWLVGKNDAVYAPTSPISEFAESSLNDALQLWEKKKRFKAKAVFKRVQQIAKADHNCKAILDRRKEDIPSGLETVPKSGILAVIIAFMFGSYGLHNFYLGHWKNGFMQLGLSFGSFGFLFSVTLIWGWIDAIRMATGSLNDGRGLPLDWRGTAILEGSNKWWAIGVTVPLGLLFLFGIIAGITAPDVNTHVQKTKPFDNVAPPPSNQAPLVNIDRTEPQQPKEGADFTIFLTGSDPDSDGFHFEYRTTGESAWVEANAGRVLLTNLKGGQSLDLEFRTVDANGQASTILRQNWIVHAPKTAAKPTPPNTAITIKVKGRLGTLTTMESISISIGAKAINWNLTKTNPTAEADVTFPKPGNYSTKIRSECDVLIGGMKRRFVCREDGTLAINGGETFYYFRITTNELTNVGKYQAILKRKD